MPSSKLQYRCPICGQIEGNCKHLTVKEDKMLSLTKYIVTRGWRKPIDQNVEVCHNMMFFRGINPDGKIRMMQLYSSSVYFGEEPEEIIKDTQIRGARLLLEKMYLEMFEIKCLRICRHKPLRDDNNSWIIPPSFARKQNKPLKQIAKFTTESDFVIPATNIEVYNEKLLNWIPIEETKIKCHPIGLCLICHEKGKMVPLIVSERNSQEVFCKNCGWYNWEEACIKYRQKYLKEK